MSDTHLPDDVSRWPEDLYALLGVPANVDRRELRRAYARLIRVYKPEHFPEQFRRIRDAYEKLDGFLQYREYFENQQENAADKGENQREGASGNVADRQVDGDRRIKDAEGETVPPSADLSLPRLPDGQMPAVRPQPAAEDPVAKAWAKATAGGREEAYRELCELERQQPGEEALCARLYWLLVLSPKLDLARDRRDWLAAGLRKSGLSGPLMELYSREIHGDPEEALHARCESMMRCDCLPLRLANFAALRWVAVGAIGRWEIIPEDLQNLRERIFHADRGAWTRLLLSAIEPLMWQVDPQAETLAISYRKEADEYSEEHRSLENEFYRCDILMELASGWRKMSRPAGFPQGFASQVRELLREGWLRPFGAIRPKLMEFWAPLVANPRHSIAHLDRLFQISPATVQHLYYQVEAIYRQQHDFSQRIDQATMREPLRNFYSSFSRVDYSISRNQAMFFCIRYNISLGEFLEQGWPVIAEMHLQNSGLPERMHNDLPLHCMTLGCLAFWS